VSTLSEARIVDLLIPYFAAEGELARMREIAPKLAIYLDLLERWNARTNLTAIRAPEEMVQRHFGESLFTAAKLAACMPSEASLLDFGSGAGFPGLPIQLYFPGLRCTLAESQGKKAAFLREAVRSLGLPTQVWAARVEAMPAERLFQCVTMRAVDNMTGAVSPAVSRLAAGGILALLAGEAMPFAQPDSLELSASFPIPESDRRVLYLYTRR
jgi:16S rRNA (guanine527-N7)-methyltransferase